jgi:hypothetical protein
MPQGELADLPIDPAYCDRIELRQEALEERERYRRERA